MSVEIGGKKNINRPNWSSFQLKKFSGGRHFVGSECVTSIFPDEGFSAFAVRPKIG
jgi:hypothetical protein